LSKLVVFQLMKIIIIYDFYSITSHMKLLIRKHGKPKTKNKEKIFTAR